MDEIAGRDVAPLLARTAGLQRDLLDVVVNLAADIDPTDARAVAAAAPAVAGEALRTWWRQATSMPYPPDAAAIGRMIDVARGDATATDVAHGWRLQRTAQRLRLVRPLGEVSEPR
jgi:tRNA(Ile)-lysidine synthase